MSKVDIRQKRLERPVHAEVLEPVNRLLRSWGWFIAGGIAFVLLGGAALASPFAATLSLSLTLGALFLLGGLVHLFQTFRLWKAPGRWAHLVQSALALLAGWLMLRNPAIGILGISFVLSFYLVVSGIGRWMLANEMRPQRGSGWMIFSAVISILLGVFLVIGMPFSALWVPGVFLGVDLVFYGASLLAIGAGLRRAKKWLEPRSRRHEAEAA